MTLREVLRIASVGQVVRRGPLGKEHEVIRASEGSNYLKAIDVSKNAVTAFDILAEDWEVIE